MTTDSPGPATPAPAGGGGLDEAAFAQMNQSPEFQRLKSTFRRFVFPMTAAFLIWYLLYVVLSAYARGFMGTKVLGNINVALVFGLLQFLSTFLIAWAYERHARRKLEPLAAQVAAPGAAPAALVPEPAPAPDDAVKKAPAAEEPAADGPAEGSADEAPAGKDPSDGTEAGDGREEEKK
ncbi:DUF485 domain-containing protein [Actinomadura rugatobispora]|uniref:DUF485 domain-containing protein n=1 Tax=Actinomadura rugatobispora TaxID=1994 RepID=A0ABW1AIY7_9ACTN|nr:hypothetical protein GCM10010200_009800 [Actinomadura rugatobispora]